jgi:hypothetical protein
LQIVKVFNYLVLTEAGFTYSPKFMPVKLVNALTDNDKELLNKIRGLISPLNCNVPDKVKLDLLPTDLFDLKIEMP